VARSEDIRRMDDSAIAERPQITSRTISKWRDVLSTVQIAQFEERHADLIRDLGYQPATASSPPIQQTPRGADPWLTADEETICPTSVRTTVRSWPATPR
jgi:hypothetical protein